MPVRIGFSRAIALTALGAVACWATATAIAAEAASDERALEEVIVTGSRIAVPNAVSTSPIQVVSSQEILTGGKTDIGDILNQLPQNFTNDLGQDLGNGTSGLTTAGGVSTADLRGLGPNRTLVLVDGRRLGQGSPYTFIQSPAPDLDQIPAGLVERVEVVTGGASATYGSDAIAGVVNFIMKRNFQGLQVSGELDGNYHHNGNSDVQQLVRDFNQTPATGTHFDGKRRTFDVLMGTNFADGKGNITAYLSYRHQDPVAGNQRDFGSCQLNATHDADGNVNGVKCGGSSNSNFFMPDAGANAGTVYSVSGTSFTTSRTLFTTPPVSFNSQPYIYMTRQDDRYNAAFLGHYELADYVQPYAEFYFMDDRTHQKIAPVALFKDNVLDPTGAGDWFTNCSNPLLSAQQAGILCTADQITADALSPGSVKVPILIGRRNIEGGGRTSDYEHENYRMVLGAKGDLGEAWNYDAYGQYYYTSFFNSQHGYFNLQNVANALLVTGTAANPQCIPQYFTTAACVPWNIWSDGGVRQDQLNYLYAVGTGAGSSSLRTLHGEVTGQLGKYGVVSPLAHDGLAVNVGYEHRTDQEKFEPDATEASGLLEGFGSAAVPIDNSVSVDEEWAELRAPLVQDKTGVKDLLFDTGFRHSNYSTTGGVNTYKFEVQYAPIEDYRLRLSYDRAIRAPSVIELYNPQLVGLVQLGADPCAPTFDSNGNKIAAATYSLAQCQNMGVTAAQYGNGFQTNTIPQATADQLQQLQGGNPNLTPETATTYTIGINFAPRQIANFSGSIDYYNIKLKNGVGVIPVDVIFQNCGQGEAFYCSQVVRNQATGGLNSGTLSTGGYIVQSNVNAGAGLNTGIDVQMNYKYDLPKWGGLNFALNGAYLSKVETTPIPGAHTYDCAGLFGHTCQTINPRWHHILRASWMTPWQFTAAVTWRYIGSVSEDNNSSDPSLNFATWGAPDNFNGKISAFSYIDLAGTWNPSEHFELRAGLNNILDKDPPVIINAIVGGGAANTYSIYDMFGTQAFVAFTAKF
jgi:iron complex outermembrane receptor protein